jgi:hypothetical protein
MTCFARPAAAGVAAGVAAMPLCRSLLFRVGGWISAWADGFPRGRMDFWLEGLDGVALRFRAIRAIRVNPAPDPLLA